MQQEKKRSWQKLGSLFLMGLLLTSCALGGKNETPKMKSIEGMVWYRERMILPPNIDVQVSLEDVARADAPSDQIATTHFTPKGTPPWAFELKYDPSKLKTQGRYALRARIEADGQLMFINNEYIPAFDRNPDEPLNILVVRVGGPNAGKGATMPQ